MSLNVERAVIARSYQYLMYWMHATSLQHSGCCSAANGWRLCENA